MKKNLIFLAVLMFTFSACKQNGAESKLPEETVELSEYAGEPVDLGLSVLWADDNLSKDGFFWADINVAGNRTDWEDPYDESIMSHSGSKYDAARMNWGGEWRTPTDAEWKELITKCTREWDGKGMKVTGPSGKSIYLNAELGYWNHCYYWTSSRIKKGEWEGSPAAVFVSEFGFSGPEPCSERNTCKIRPVRNK